MGQDDLYFCTNFGMKSSFKSAVSYGRAPPKMLPMTHIISHQADFKVKIVENSTVGFVRFCLSFFSWGEFCNNGYLVVRPQQISRFILDHEKALVNFT